MSKLFHKQQRTQEHGQHQNQNVEDCNKSSVDWKKQNLAVVEDGRNKGVAKIFFKVLLGYTMLIINKILIILSVLNP